MGVGNSMGSLPGLGQIFGAQQPQQQERSHGAYGIEGPTGLRTPQDQQGDPFSGFASALGGLGSMFGGGGMGGGSPMGQGMGSPFSAGGANPAGFPGMGAQGQPTNPQDFYSYTMRNNPYTDAKTYGGGL